MNTPIDHLLTLRRLADQSGDAALSQWLTDGLDGYLFGGNDLEKSLGLKAAGRGKRTARRRYLEAQRNRYLRLARDTLTDKPPGWPRSVELSLQIERFESIVWPRWLSLDRPPDGISDLRRFLFHARRGGDLPTDPSHLHSLCTLLD